MATRAEIEGRASRYLHRDDFTEADFDFAFAVCGRELGQWLRGSVNQVTATLATVSGAADLGASCREVSLVQSQQAGGWYPLQGTTAATLARVQGLAGTPAFYTVVGQWLHVAPTADVPVEVTYWEEPSLLMAPGASNAVSEQYPELYVYRVCQELALITQDMELAAAYAGKFSDRLADLNTQAAMLSTGNAPSMQQT